MRLLVYFHLLLSLLISVSCGGDPASVTEPDPEPTPPPVEEPAIPKPDPDSRILYNGITLPSWPPSSSWQSNLFEGMLPKYLVSKPSVINIELGRQLFVDDFLIAETNLKRVWHQATYHSGNPIFEPETEWEMSPKGGGFAAPFSDGVWYDEVSGKFKMWYMGGGKQHGDGAPVTCYAESSDGIRWSRPALNLVSGTNIVHRGETRDSYSVWIDKTANKESERYKMFGVYGGAGNWKYHYMTSSDGKSWRHKAESKSIADRSTVFHNPFRGVWVYSMRHNVRVDTKTLIRARDYSESANAEAGTKEAEADLDRFWFGPWPNEPRHTNPKYSWEQPAIYNLDAIGYESVMVGTFSVWSGPENDVSHMDNVIKRNQLLLGFSRDGWNWHREDFVPFCATSEDTSEWNNGNIQSACGSPIIVGDKLYFYMSGRRLNSDNREITSTGLATLRRDGFASMSGTGTLTTEVVKFSGEHLYVNANISGSLTVEVLDEKGVVIDGFSKDKCTAITSDETKMKVVWSGKKTLAELKDKKIKLRFHLENGDLYAFWISQFEDGKSYGYTGGGGVGLSKYGIDL